MIALGIISVPFFLIGLYLITRHYQFKLKGEKIYGKVIAYEKYKSRSSTNRNASQLLYAPIIKFQYRSKIKYLKEAGSNRFLYQLGKKIELRVLNNDINHIKSMSLFSLTFGLIFFLVGTISIIVHMNRYPSESIEFYVPILLALLIPAVGYIVLNKKGYIKDIIEAHYTNGSIFEEFEPNRFISSIQEMNKETKRHKSSGLFISLIFSIILAWIGYLTWSKIPKQNQQSIMDPQMWDQIKFSSSEPIEMIFIFIVFLGIVFTLSIIKQLRS